jgi:hypothetical protein
LPDVVGVRKRDRTRRGITDGDRPRAVPNEKWKVIALPKGWQLNRTSGIVLQSAGPSWTGSGLSKLMMTASTGVVTASTTTIAPRKKVARFHRRIFSRALRPLYRARRLCQQYRRRPGAGAFRRRSHGEPDDRSLAYSGLVRDRAQHRTPGYGHPQRPAQRRSETETPKAAAGISRDEISAAVMRLAAEARDHSGQFVTPIYAGAWAVKQP